MALDDLWDKISSYNIFNNLLPGVLFVVLSPTITGFNFEQDNLLLAAFVYYLIGMVVSRAGALIVEPFFRKIGFLKFSEYGDFVHASAKDGMIATLSEASDSYRTLCALFPLLIALRGYKALEQEVPIITSWTPYLLICFLFLLFLFSYRKQTNYINQRIHAGKPK
jgi:hypothetical protein